MKKLLVILAAVWGLTLGLQSTSHALSLILYDNENLPMTTVVDGGVGDASADAGVILWNGGLGNWLVNVTTGLSKPVIGSATYPSLDLNSVDVSSSAGGHLTLWLVDSGFLGPVDGGTAGPFQLAVGGTTQGTVSFDLLGKDNNGEGLGGVAITNPGLDFTAGAFSGTTSGSFSATAPFSLVILANIVHEGAGASSFNAEVTPVPEPATLLLLGLGLVGLAGIRRKFKS